jgi:hypothetical protein
MAAMAVIGSIGSIVYSARLHILQAVATADVEIAIMADVCWMQHNNEAGYGPQTDCPEASSPYSVLGEHCSAAAFRIKGDYSIGTEQQTTAGYC